MPTLDFVYDKQGNVVNILPKGAQNDIVARQFLGDTNVEHAQAPYHATLAAQATAAASYAGTTEERMTWLSPEQKANGLLPWIRKETILGYAKNEPPPDRDLHRITTASPLITSDRQPPEVDSRPMSLARTSVPLKLDSRERILNAHPSRPPYLWPMVQPYNSVGYHNPN